MTSGFSTIRKYIAWYDFSILCHMNVCSRALDSASLLEQTKSCGVIADAVSKLDLPYDGASLPSLPSKHPVTGRDWANAALFEAGFEQGLEPTARIF